MAVIAGNMQDVLVAVPFGYQGIHRALLAKWPDITKDEDSPWSDAPLMNNARGNVFYFGMVSSGAEEASTFAAALAKEQGLVCFDPQTGRLRPNDVDDKPTKRAERYLTHPVTLRRLERVLSRFSKPQALRKAA